MLLFRYFFLKSVPTSESLEARVPMFYIEEGRKEIKVYLDRVYP